MKPIIAQVLFDPVYTAGINIGNLESRVYDVVRDEIGVARLNQSLPFRILEPCLFKFRLNIYNNLIWRRIFNEVNYL